MHKRAGQAVVWVRFGHQVQQFVSEGEQLIEPFPTNHFAKQTGGVFVWEILGPLLQFASGFGSPSDGEIRLAKKQTAGKGQIGIATAELTKVPPQGATEFKGVDPRAYGEQVVASGVGDVHIMIFGQGVDIAREEGLQFAAQSGCAR